MKKLNFSFYLFVLALIALSCKKSDVVSSSDWNANIENDDSKRNEATWIYDDDHSKWSLIKLKIFVGHTAEECGGKCMKIFGEYYHFDCRGFGRTCKYNVVAKLAEGLNGDDLKLILEDYESLGDFEIFPFPDRSFVITNPQNNDELWLNIPEQMLVIDSLLDQVVFENVWFSEEQELENE
jgi:hypothetical protein